MAIPALYLASVCYGGIAHADLLRSVLALRAACAEADVALQLEFGGGEALISRARAGMLVRFLASAATHLLFVPSDGAFSAVEVLRRMAGPQPVIALGDQILLVRREAAEQVVEAHPELQAGLQDLRGAGLRRAPMVFESLLDADTGGYLADLAAFTRRWRDLGGVVAPW